MHEMCVAALKGDVQTARRLHMELIALNKAMFVEANPIPVKWALQQMGRMPGGIRLPLTPLSPQYHDTVRKALSAAGLLA